MRVLHLIARLNVGGTARYITRLAKEMPSRGVETFIATGFTQGEEVEDPSAQKIDVLRIPSLGRAINPMSDLRARRELLDVIQRIRPDVLHTHTFKAGAIGRTNTDRLKNVADKDVKFVHTFHGHLFDDPEFKGMKSSAIVALERRLAKSTDTLVTVGRKVGQDLLRRQIGSTDQYVSIAPGVDPLDITPREEAFANLKLRGDERLVVGWIARVTGVKNPMRALEVARALPEVHFVMAGGGDLFEQIKSQAPGNVSVVGWSKAADLFGVSDIILSTSENEGMPIALIEAQMAGKPVVATDVGSVSEVIIDDESGFVTPKSTEYLVTALRKLISDDELRRSFGAAASDYSHSRFSVKKMIDEHCDLYESFENLN
jgi:glycosyltransferase involved in cell wall biosynthesis